MIQKHLAHYAKKRPFQLAVVLLALVALFFSWQALTVKERFAEAYRAFDTALNTQDMDEAAKALATIESLRVDELLTITASIHYANELDVRDRKEEAEKRLKNTIATAKSEEALDFAEVSLVKFYFLNRRYEALLEHLPASFIESVYLPEYALMAAQSHLNVGDKAKAKAIYQETLAIMRDKGQDKNPTYIILRNAVSTIR